MRLCNHPTVAYRVHPRTLDLITALDGGVEPKIEETPTFFMIFCSGSDHEDTEIIDEETYNRTYGEMPGHVLVMQVNTID